ncbi:SMI1/KNR4 family protein [Actinomadura kijaniata]|uniref:SMI1/KNR4 family protein n=1 Tax=Actinomadura kijaniata TaxID=46161 RepID=UPI00082F0FF9|nr:SMI1/KNR4 family protein [Actinomadura kijaniata]
MGEFPYLEKFRAQVEPPEPEPLWEPAFDALETLPPPSRQLLEWEQVFEELGTALPPDFVAFIQIYGASSFGNDFLGISDPREFIEPTYAQAMRAQGDRYRALRDDYPQFHPLAAWPEPGGFLSWGFDVDGNTFGWLTQGEPSQWPTAVWGRQMPDGVIDHVPMTQFMYGWLTTPITYPQCFPPLPGLVSERDLDENRKLKPHIPRKLTCRRF